MSSYGPSSVGLLARMAVVGICAGVWAMAGADVLADAAEEVREAAAQALLNAKPGLTLADDGMDRLLSERISRYKAVIREYPETFAALDARCGLVATQVLYVQEVLKLPATSPPGRATRAEAVSDLIAVAEDPRCEGGDAGQRRLRYTCLAMAAKYAEDLGEFDQAKALNGAILAEWPDGPRAALALWALVRMHKDAVEWDEYEACLTKLHESEHRGHWAWERAIVVLPEYYLDRATPPRPELTAALARKALTSTGGEFTEEDVAPKLQWLLQRAKGELAAWRPQRRVAAYLRLWQKGYYNEMYRYLAASAKQGRPEAWFASAMKGLAEQGLRPAGFAVLPGAEMTGQQTTANVDATVHFEKDAPPALVSGEKLLFRLKRMGPAGGAAALPWVIEEGPILSRLGRETPQAPPEPGAGGSGQARPGSIGQRSDNKGREMQ